jgi:hypothetical protein
MTAGSLAAALATLQVPLVGAVLVWAGALKLVGRGSARAARRSALSRLAGEDRAVPAYRAVGSAELATGTLLLLPPARAAGAVLATALCAGMLGYLGYARVVAPDSPCGCLGNAHAPVRWRSFARAALLLLASGAALLGGGSWSAAVAEHPLPAAGVLLAEACAVIVLSPELDRRWLLPLRRLRVRWRHPLAGSMDAGVPVANSVHQLLRSPAYCAASGWLRSDILDHWDEGEWRMLTYAAALGGHRVTAVFAVPRLRYEPEAVRAVLADETNNAVLWEFEPEPVPV